MKNNHLIMLIISLILLVCALPARAIDCGRAVTVVENTVCDNPELAWLDRVFTNAFSETVMQDPQRIDKIARDWMKTRDVCISDDCLREAYLQGIGKLYDANRPFSWQGTWWNTTATAGNGGKIVISNTASWEFQLDAIVTGGAYHSVYSSKVNIYYGVGFTNKIYWGGGCALILVPRPDGKLEVSSDTSGRCQLLLPGSRQRAIDGVYVKAPSDPRPAATLISLGVFPGQAMDDRFRQLAGNDYQQYVDTATSVVYAPDLDNMGATVLTMWVKGMANSKSTMIMYTPEGKIWALRVEPGKDNKLKLHYLTTEKESKAMPKTLMDWRSKFIE